MIEQNDIEFEEPTPERLEAIQHACNIFADVCRMAPHSAPQTEDDMSELTNEIVRRNLELTDSVSYTVAWHAVRNRREDTARREADLEAREETRQRQIEEYKTPANRADTIRELRAGHTASSPAGFVPTREYTDAEMSAMSADDYRRLVLGNVSIDDRQMRTNGLTVKQERDRLILADRIVNRAGVRKVKSIKFSQEELRAQEERARTVAQDKAERRQLEENWRKK